jgi:GTP cyclohydrolase I
MKTTILPDRLPDVAMEADSRGIYLPSVGVRGFRLPVQIMNDDGQTQTVLVEAEVAVSVEAEQRGAHMSRLVETLYDWAAQPRSRREVDTLLKTLSERLNSNRASTALHFDYFVPQYAPITGAFGLLDVKVRWDAKLQDGVVRTKTSLEFPAMTLCPCSKAISKYGAHNQRAYIRFQLQSNDRMPLLPEPFLQIVNETASMGVYPVMKRPDEKHVTERAYETPRFVEDVAREIALRLREMQEVVWFRVECESIESIHNHNAFAAYEEKKAK